MTRQIDGCDLGLLLTVAAATQGGSTSRDPQPYKSVLKSARTPIPLGLARPERQGGAMLPPTLGLIRLSPPNGSAGIRLGQVEADIRVTSKKFACLGSHDHVCLIPRPGRRGGRASGFASKPSGGRRPYCDTPAVRLTAEMVQNLGYACNGRGSPDRCRDQPA
jgi:hypothetical protein